MSAPLISVIVPVYNVRDYLPQCLDSLLAQTHGNLEVLCIDDASSDDSAQVVQRYLRQDSRVRLIRQEHQGVSAARNLGITQARGEYLTFVDADDWADAAMVEKLAARAEKTAAQIVVCSAQVHYETGEPRPSLERALTVEEGLWDGRESPWDCLNRSGSWPFVWNKLYKTAFLREHGISFSRELTLGEDGAFLVLAWQYASKITFLPEKLYHYRYQRKSSATVRLYRQEVGRFHQHIQVCRVLLGEFHRRKLKEADLLGWVVQFLYYDFVRLPADSRQVVSGKLKQLLGEWDQSALTRRELGRLKRMMDDRRACTRLRRSWDIWRLRIENRLMK